MQAQGQNDAPINFLNELVGLQATNLWGCGVGMSGESYEAARLSWEIESQPDQGPKVAMGFPLILVLDGIQEFSSAHFGLVRHHPAEIASCHALSRAELSERKWHSAKREDLT